MHFFLEISCRDAGSDNLQGDPGVNSDSSTI